jgi:hypothetical protein
MRFQRGVVRKPPSRILGEKQFQELTDQLAKLTNQGGWGD